MSAACSKLQLYMLLRMLQLHMLLRTAAHDTPHTATHSNTLQQAATSCNTYAAAHKYAELPPAAAACRCVIFICVTCMCDIQMCDIYVWYSYVWHVCMIFICEWVIFTCVTCMRDMHMCMSHVTNACVMWYGVATTSRLLKMIGLFCKRALLKKRYSAKETYHFKTPTHRSHPICEEVTYEWVMAQSNASCHTWMSHVTWEWVMSHMDQSCHGWVSRVSYDCVVSDVNESCHTRFLPCIMSPWHDNNATSCSTLQHTATHCNAVATHCNTLQHTATHCVLRLHACVMSNMNESCHVRMSHVTYQWVMSRTNESCHVPMSRAAP